jgi:hypothetical protein
MIAVPRKRTRLCSTGEGWLRSSLAFAVVVSVVRELTDLQVVVLRRGVRLDRLTTRHQVAVERGALFAGDAVVILGLG